MSLKKLLSWLVEWEQEPETHKMKHIANAHFLRAHMDGEVVKKTGEVIPKETT